MSGVLTVPRGTYQAMRSAILQQVVAEEGSVRKAALVLDVPRSTLGAWVRQVVEAKLRICVDPGKIVAIGPPVAVFLRALAAAVESGEVNASDVTQALTRSDGYNVGCPISEAQNESISDVPDRLMAMLEDLENQIAGVPRA